MAIEAIRYARRGFLGKAAELGLAATLGGSGIIAAGELLGVIQAPDFSMPRITSKKSLAKEQNGRIPNTIADGTQEGWNARIPVQANVDFSKEHPNEQLTYSIT